MNEWKFKNLPPWCTQELADYELLEIVEHVLLEFHSRDLEHDWDLKTYLITRALRRRLEKELTE